MKVVASIIKDGSVLANVSDVSASVFASVGSAHAIRKIFPGATVVVGGSPVEVDQTLI